MNKKIILSGFQLTYADILLKKLPSNFDVNLIIIHPDDYSLAKKTIKSARILNRFDSRVADFRSLINVNLNDSIDADTYEYYTQFLETGLSMFSRMDSTGKIISYEERLHAFWKMVSLWDSYIKENKINLIISREVPHFTSEYIMSRACERYGGKVIMTVYVEHLIRTMIYDSFEDRTVLKKHGEITEAGKNKAKKIVKKLKKNYDDAVTEVIADVNLNHRDSGVIWELKRFIRLFGWAVKNGPFNKSNISLSLGSHRKWKKNPSRINVAKYFYFSGWTIGKLQKYYRSICSPEKELPDKFVFFAPNYQPEQTTIPDGGKFYDLPNVVNLLLDCIPDDWFVVYKEHPASFKKPYKHMFRGNMMRSTNYYERMKNHKLIFVNENVDTFSLVDKSSLVASVTGTIMIEASSRDKRSIMFGNVWYQTIPGVDKIRTHEELIAYFEEKKYKNEIVYEKLLDSIAIMESVSVDYIPLLNGHKNEPSTVSEELDVFLEGMLRVVNS